MADTPRSPAELRNMFGANLRQLAQGYPSISELSRQLGINRTQFNRYLSGESFPRPDVLARICSFFEVDARVLLEPVASINLRNDAFSDDFLQDFVGAGVPNIPEDVFPSGFYRWSRRSFLDQSQFVVGMVYVFRQGPTTYLRGFEARAAVDAQGLPNTPRAREFRGLILQQEDGVSALVSRRGARTASFNFLSRVTSFENNYWVGYTARTMRESPDSSRIERVVYEHVGTSFRDGMRAARSQGYCTLDDLLPFHQRQLQPDLAFR